MNIIVKTTNKCNLNCAYCYHRHMCELSDDDINEGFTAAKLKLLMVRIKELSSFYGIYDFDFTWHGGEPLLMPIEFFEKAVALEKRYLSKKIRIQNSIMTNFTRLISDDYRERICNMGFSVGFSYDVINLARDPKNKYKTNILRNIFRFKRCGVGLGAIVMVSRYNIKYPRAIFNFFYDYGIDFSCHQIVPYEKKHRNVAVSNEEYDQFMRTMFSLWRDRKFRRVKITNFCQMASLLKNADLPTLCVFRENCAYTNLHIAVNGDIYPCDNMYAFKKMKYGNIFDNDFGMSEIFEESSKPIKIMQLRENVINKLCRRCKYYRMCYGGCPSRAAVSTGSLLNKTDLCRHYKRTFAMIKPYVEQILQ